MSLSLSGNINYLTEGESSPRQTIYGHQKNITAFDRSPSSPPTLWSGGSDGQIYYWKTDSAKPSAQPVDGSTHATYVSSIAAGHEGNVLSAGWDDTLRHIDATAATFTGSAASTDGQPRGVAVAGGKWIVGTHKGLEVYNADGTRASFLATSFSTTCVSASPKAALVAIGADDAIIRIYAVSGDNLKLDAEIPASTSAPTTLAFSSNGASLAAGCANGKIIVYNTSSWEPSITRWSAHTGRVTSISWRGDDKFAVSGGLDTNVFVWSVEKPGRRITVGNAHKEGVNGVRWIDDGTVVSAGADAALKTWTVEGL